MLKRLRVSNYKCLRDVTVDFSDFTVLIGLNDSGKSSFIEALKMACASPSPPKFQQFLSSRRSLVWRKDQDLEIAWELTGFAAGKLFEYRLGFNMIDDFPRENLKLDGNQMFTTEVSNTSQGPRVAIKVIGGQSQPAQLNATFLGRMSQQAGPFREIVEFLTSNIEYDFDLEKLRQPTVPTQKSVLGQAGEDLAGVLDKMQNSPDRSCFDEVQQRLTQAIPTLERVILPSGEQGVGAKNLEFLLAGDTKPLISIPARQMSTGSLLLTAYLTLVYSSAPNIICIEEPENGLHPSRLRYIVELLRTLCAGKIDGRTRQVIATTHSPLLLNLAEPKEIQVFVRDKKKGTIVKSMKDVPNIENLNKEFGAGELWFLLGEDKLFKGPEH